MRPLFWVGDSLEKLRGFPEEVRQAIGYALHVAQQGETTLQTKVMRGMGGRDTNTEVRYGNDQGPT